MKKATKEAVSFYYLGTDISGRHLALPRGNGYYHLFTETTEENGEKLLSKTGYGDAEFIKETYNIVVPK